MHCAHVCWIVCVSVQRLTLVLKKIQCAQRTPNPHQIEVSVPVGVSWDLPALVTLIDMGVA